jgi:hypothetical protein
VREARTAGAPAIVPQFFISNLLAGRGVERPVHKSTSRHQAPPAREVEARDSPSVRFDQARVCHAS